MELSITTGENDIFVYPVDPALPPSVREALSERGGGRGALYVATVHLTVPSDVKAKHLRAGVHKLECALVGRENLGFASGGAMEQNIPFSLDKVLDQTQVVDPATAFVTPSHSRPHSPPAHPAAVHPAAAAADWTGHDDAGKSPGGASALPSTSASSAGPSTRASSLDLRPPATPPPELRLEPGKMYSWDFIFDIPQDIAPYERCRYGRLYYRLTAKLTLNSGGGLLGSGRKVLTASKVCWLLCSGPCLPTMAVTVEGWENLTGLLSSRMPFLMRSQPTMAPWHTRSTTTRKRTSAHCSSLPARSTLRSAGTCGSLCPCRAFRRTFISCASQPS